MITLPALSVRRIFHPTDFSPHSMTAFAHALRLACLTQAELTIMHVDPTVGRSDFEDFPRVRPLLTQWGLLPNGSTKQDVTKLGIQIKKIRAIAGNPLQALRDHLAKSPTDLLVLSTHQREGLARLAQQAVAEPFARSAHTKSLFVPAHVEGFVSAKTGLPSLRRILIPVAQHPHPQPAVDFATQLACVTGSDKVLFELVHVGEENGQPKVTMPEQPGWTWHTLTAKGNPVEWILATGSDFDVDLIVMMTEGHTSFMDAVHGSTTEQVLRGSRCPLLAIPASPKPTA
jgi:nucleotide-binding universal stress UspA family protein